MPCEADASADLICFRAQILDHAIDLNDELALWGASCPERAHDACVGGDDAGCDCVGNQYDDAIVMVVVVMIILMLLTMIVVMMSDSDDPAMAIVIVMMVMLII